MNLLEIQESTQLNNLELLAKQVVEGFITGLHKSPFHGFSVEFAEHRIYNPGEPTKHIDWKLFAKTDKLFVKRYEEETNLRCQIIIDNSSSMLFPYKAETQSKLAYATYCTAALINLLRKQRDAVGLTIFSDKIDLHTNNKLSSTHAQYLYSELDKLIKGENIAINKKPNTAEILHQVAESIHKRSLIIIFSDMIQRENNEDIFSALQHLKYNKHEVILFHTIDKKLEQEFKYKHIPYKFIDLETNEEIRFNPNDIRSEYVNSTKKYFENIKNKCTQYKIDFVEADINADFKNVLIPYLIKRSKLY